MTHTDETQIDVASPSEVAHNSLLQQVRDRRSTLKGNRTGVIEIPGYKGMLYARYTGLTWEAQKKIGDKAAKSKSPRREINAALDFLASACDAVLIAEDGELTELKNGDAVCRYDQNLAQVLNIDPAENARQIILGLFPNEVAVTTHYVDFNEFQSGEDAEIDQEVLDELDSDPTQEA